MPLQRPEIKTKKPSKKQFDEMLNYEDFQEDDTRIYKPKKKKDSPLELKNQFIAWLYSLDSTAYPLQRPIIDRVQKWKRPALIEDTIELWLTWMDAR